MRVAVEKTGKSIKWRKAEGRDGVVVEMVEAAGNFATHKITNLANTIYRTGEVQQYMMESELLLIPKKNGVVECGKHRTNSIMSQVARIVLKALDERLKIKVEDGVYKAQFGFRKSLGTRNATFM